MLNVGVIGYGVRVDMLMDNLLGLEREVRVKAVADLDPERVKALMTKSVPDQVRYDLELDKIDAKLLSTGARRRCWTRSSWTA